MKLSARPSAIMAIAVIAIVTLLAACSSSPYSSSTTPATTSPPASTTPAPTTSSPAPTTTAAALSVNVASNAKLGNYLVDSKGMTLYYFTRDTINKSTATGATLAAWPVFSPASFVLPAGLNTADFSTITRDDGLKIATYKGWPLYYYAKDQNPGDVLGEAVGGVWFVIKVPFYTVMLQTKTDPGNYLVDARGMTLYYFTKDSVGKSTATGTVLANWPLFNPASFVTISTLNTSDFSTITRDDGAKVATYKGWPLYYYINDKASGDTLGQAVGGVWFVINPANFPPTPTPTSTTPPASTTTPPPSTTATPTPTKTPTPTPYSVNIAGFAFSPATLTVPVGARVTWTNNDGVGHTVTSDTGLFNGSVNNGASFSFTFTQAGTFAYHCAIHPSMTAKVIVQ